VRDKKRICHRKSTVSKSCGKKRAKLRRQEVGRETGTRPRGEGASSLYEGGWKGGCCSLHTGWKKLHERQTQLAQLRHEVPTEKGTLSLGLTSKGRARSWAIF